MAKPRTPRTPKVKIEKPETKVLQMPESAGTNGNSNHSALNVESEIRLRAYELYERRGYVDGLAEQDWLEAEREVLARKPQKYTA